MSKKFLSALFLSLTLLGLVTSGCRTMNGAGQDIERAGQKIQDNAKNHD